MSKRMFQILDEMNVADGENKTTNVAVSNHLVRADKAKGGAHIVMGVEEKYLYDIMAYDKKAVILLVIDRKEYEKIQAQPQGEIETLKAENSKMRNALEWYADAGNYLGDNGELATAWKQNENIKNKATEAIKSPNV